MRIIAVTDKGGSVVLSENPYVWASYAVATVANLAPSPIFYAGIELGHQRNVCLFVNQETGIVVVDIQRGDGKGGNEVLRVNAFDVKLPTLKEIKKHEQSQSQQEEPEDQPDELHPDSSARRGASR